MILYPDAPIYEQDGAPIFWFVGPRGPGRTFGSDAGDIPDAAGNVSAGVRSGYCAWGTSPYGACLAFNGTAGSVAFGPIPWPAGANSATASFLLRSTADGVFAGIPGDYDDSWWPNTTDIYMGLFDSNRRPLNPVPSTGLNFSLWHTLHVISAPGTGNYQVWIDGALRGSTTRWVFNPPTGIWLGRGVHTSYTYTGPIALAAIYPRVLTAAEIARDVSDPFWRFRPTTNRLVLYPLSRYYYPAMMMGAA